MALFSSTFSFAAPSSRPSHLYPLTTLAPDSISPTSSRCGSPSSPTSSSSSLSSGTLTTASSIDDLHSLTTHLSHSSLYPSRPYHPLSRPPTSGRRSPPRSTPFTLPPTCSTTSQPSVDLLARRERRQAYVQDQLSTQSRRKLSLLVARMLGDEIEGDSRSRRGGCDGLHPSNVRVVPAMPKAGTSGVGSRRNTLAELRSSDEEEEGEMEVDGDVVESIESGEVGGRSREGKNRICKRRSGDKGRRSGGLVRR